MGRVIQIKVSGLKVGNVITDGPSRIPVKEIGPCPSTLRRGVPKIHVNGTLCYDTAGYVNIHLEGK